MQDLLPLILGFGSLAVIIWLLRSSGTTASPGNDAVIDPTNGAQIGWLMGLAGGDIVDAAVTRYALDRFEQVHGRKPTVRDVGIVIGMMCGLE